MYDQAGSLGYCTEFVFFHLHAIDKIDFDPHPTFCPFKKDKAAAKKKAQRAQAKLLFVFFNELSFFATENKKHENPEN